MTWGNGEMPVVPEVRTPREARVRAAGWLEESVCSNPFNTEYTTVKQPLCQTNVSTPAASADDSPTPASTCPAASAIPTPAKRRVTTSSASAACAGKTLPAGSWRNRKERIEVAVVAKRLRKLVSLLEAIPPTLGTHEPWKRAYEAATSFMDDMAFLLSNNSPRADTRELVAARNALTKCAPQIARMSPKRVAQAASSECSATYAPRSDGVERESNAALETNERESKERILAESAAKLGASHAVAASAAEPPINGAPASTTGTDSGARERAEVAKTLNYAEHAASGAPEHARNGADNTTLEPSGNPAAAAGWLGNTQQKPSHDAICHIKYLGATSPKKFKM